MAKRDAQPEWSFSSNDLSGEYLTFEVHTLQEALAGARALKLERSDRHVWVRGFYYDFVARPMESKIGFVIVPIFAENGNYDPPAECWPYEADEIVALEERQAVLVPIDEECPTCGCSRRGYEMNRGRAGEHYFACLSCQEWTSVVPVAKPVGRRSRPSSLT